MRTLPVVVVVCAGGLMSCGGQTRSTSEGTGLDTGPAEALQALTDFETDDGGWGDTSQGVSFRDWSNSFPTPSCDRTGRFSRFDDGSVRHMQLDAAIDAAD